MCEICLDVLSDPVQAVCCGQSFCSICIDKEKRGWCPHCREKLETFVDKKSIRLINELKICCPYHIDDKCDWKGSPSEVVDHLKQCSVKPVCCPLQCGKHVKPVCCPLQCGKQFEQRNL